MDVTDELERIWGLFGWEPATPFEVIEGMSLSDPRMPPAERLRRMALLTKCGRVPVDKSDAAVDAAYRSAVDGRIATQEQIE